MLNTRTVTLLHLAESEVEAILLRNKGPLKRMVNSEDGLEKLIALRRTQFLSRVEHGSIESCWRWTGCLFPAVGTNLQYGATQIFGYATTSHRASFIFEYGCIPALLNVCHTCDNPACVNPSHLFLGTHQDNRDDCKAKGRIVNNPRKGEEHYASTLTNSDVLSIRQMRSEGMKFIDIGSRFGITGGLASLISRRKRWKHI